MPTLHDVVGPLQETAPKALSVLINVQKLATDSAFQSSVELLPSVSRCCVRVLTSRGVCALVFAGVDEALDDSIKATLALNEPAFRSLFESTGLLPPAGSSSHHHRNQPQHLHSDDDGFLDEHGHDHAAVAPAVAAAAAATAEAATGNVAEPRPRTETEGSFF